VQKRRDVTPYKALNTDGV